MAFKTGVAFLTIAALSTFNVHGSQSHSRIPLEENKHSKKIRIEVLSADSLEQDLPVAERPSVDWDVFNQNVPPVHQKTLLSIVPLHGGQWLRTYLAVALRANECVLNALHEAAKPSTDEVREFYAYLGGRETLDLGLTPNVNKAIKELAIALRYDQRKVVLRDLDFSHILPHLESYMGLRFVKFTGCQISDMQAFANLMHLAQLHTLKLDKNQIVDIKPLEYLIHLRKLWLSENQIKDITPLKRLSQLKELDLKKNQVVDLAPLMGLSYMTKLNLNGNGIVNIAPLAHLSQLRELSLDGNKIADLEALAELKELKVLDVARNQVTDVSPLGGLLQLEDLTIEKNQVTDISPLRSLVHLTDLHLHKNPIKDLEPLAQLSELGFLYASVPDNMEYLSLHRMFGLADLALYITSVRDLKSFATLPSVFQISLIVSQDFKMKKASRAILQLFGHMRNMRVYAKYKGMKDQQTTLYSSFK